MIDPRYVSIERRLGKIKEIIAVSGGKGGVGKSTVASLLSLYLRNRNYEVGLLDLDLFGPSTHKILGIKDLTFEEKDGILPPDFFGLKFMSIVLFTKGRALPVGGDGVREIIRDILSLISWGDLDFLVIDMPPGTSDTMLEVLRLIKDLRFLLVTTFSPLAHEALRREISLLKSLGKALIGVVGNQLKNNELPISDLYGVRLLGNLPFDEDFEQTIGSVDSILGSRLYLKAAELFDKTFGSKPLNGYSPSSH